MVVAPTTIALSWPVTSSTTMEGMVATATVLEVALEYHKAELAVIPIKLGGSKAPALTSWKQYQTAPPTLEELHAWFAAGKHGIAIVCGSISGNLEVLDFDDPSLLTPWKTAVRECAGKELLRRLVLVETPGPGYQVYYKCTEPVSGNRKLAQRLIEGKPHAVIETRGEGGYVVAPGSPPEVHEQCKPYELQHGDITNLPILTPEEHEVVVSSAQALNEYVPEQCVVSGSNGEAPTRPGDDYNQRVSWNDILSSHGWTRECTRADGTELWRRPGKTKGHSATANYAGSNLLYVFSSTCDPFMSDRAYSKFAAYTLLEHKGDFTAAARKLAELGYGSSRKVASNGDGTDVSADPIEHTDIAAARHFVLQYGHQFHYVAEHKSWIVWDGTRWQDDMHSKVLALAKEHAERLYRDAWNLSDLSARKAQAAFALRLTTRAKLEAVVKLSESEPGVSISQQQLDAHDELLNCPNGILDVMDGSLHPHDRKFLFTKMTGTSYDPEAKCPLWLKFLNQIMQGRQDLVTYLQLALGYTLTAETDEQCIFVAHGSGANGKTTLLETVMHVMGDYSKSVRFETFTTRRNPGPREDIAHLVGARMVLSGEPGVGDQLDEGMIKLLTGGESVMCRRLYGSHFEYRPTYKIWLACNHKPSIKGTDQGIWRRIRLLPFDVTIEPEKQDKTLRRKLAHEAPGILRWIVEGCMAWVWEGLHSPGAVLDATQDYREDMDPFSEFIRARCDVNPNLTVLSSELYKAYQDYCEKEKVKPASKTRFGLYLVERNFKKGREGGTGTRRWDGLALKLD